MIKSLKKYIAVIKRQWAVLVTKLKDESKRQLFLKKYIPKYGTRTKEEHEANRRLATGDPKTCTHLKGYYRGLNRCRYSTGDYNLTDHTFTDGSRRIRCNRCGRKWFPGDSDWPDALKMMVTSKNCLTASEIPIGMNRRPDGIYVGDVPLAEARKR